MQLSAFSLLYSELRLINNSLANIFTSKSESDKCSFITSSSFDKNLASIGFNTNVCISASTELPAVISIPNFCFNILRLRIILAIRPNNILLLKGFSI